RCDLRASLHEGGRGAGGLVRERVRSWLVGAEVTLAVVLLTIAGLLVRSFLSVLAVQPGFRSESVLAFDVQSSGARYQADGDPVGRRLKAGGAWRTVVGVVSDVKSASLESSVRPQLYLPHAQDPWPPMTVVLRTQGDPLALASAVRGELKALDALLPAAKM